MSIKSGFSPDVIKNFFVIMDMHVQCNGLLLLVILWLQPKLKNCMEKLFSNNLLLA